MSRPADRLQRARRTLLVAWAVPLWLLLALALGAARPGPSAERADWRLVRQLDLTQLSLVPSGREIRAPALRHSGVDLRFSPGLPWPSPDPARLLLVLPADREP